MCCFKPGLFQDIFALAEPPVFSSQKAREPRFLAFWSVGSGKSSRDAKKEVAGSGFKGDNLRTIGFRRRGRDPPTASRSEADVPRHVGLFVCCSRLRKAA